MERSLSPHEAGSAPPLICEATPHHLVLLHEPPTTYHHTTSNLFGGELCSCSGGQGANFSAPQVPMPKQGVLEKAINAAVAVMLNESEVPTSETDTNEYSGLDNGYARSRFCHGGLHR